jgi:hypothetical protein
LALVLLLDLVEGVLEVLVIDAHHHVAEHVDQAAVGVVGEALVAGGVGQPLDRRVVRPRFRIVFIMPGIETAAPERTETSSGFFVVAELLAQFLLQHRDVLVHLVHQPLAGACLPAL